MGFENPLEKILKKITPAEKPDKEIDSRDPIFHKEGEAPEKFLEKGPEDFAKEERAEGEQKENPEKL